MAELGKKSASGVEPARVAVQPEPEKTLVSWEAPVRHFKKRNREYFTTIAVIVVLVSVILLFAKEFLLIAVILSLAFVSYALASVPPGHVIHTITTKGIRTGERLYRFEVLGRFWFEEKWGQWSLLVEHLDGFPTHLTLLLSAEVTEAELDRHLGAYLVKEKPTPSWMDRAAQWLQKKVPLETE